MIKEGGKEGGAKMRARVWPGLETLGVGVVVGVGMKLMVSLSVAVGCGVLGAVLWAGLVWLEGVVPANEQRTRELLEGLRVGAHRGAADDAPENTIYAFSQARANGADFVELDLMFTAEGVPIVFHDERLERTTDGKGFVRNTSFHNISRLNAADKWATLHACEQSIPTLRESIAAVLDLNLGVIIDVKCPHPRLVETVTALYQEFPTLYCYGLVSSFHPLEILRLRQADPRIVTAITWCWDFHAESVETGEECAACGWTHRWWWEARLLDAAQILAIHSGLLLHLTGVRVLLAHHSILCPAYVNALHSAGLHVITWTPNELSQRLFLLRHLRVPIITDRIKDIEHMLKSLDSDLRAPFVNRAVCIIK